MTPQITIIIPPETQARLAKLETLPDELPLAIARGMDFAMAQVRGRIQTQRLGGKGPYPPAEHRLGIVSQKLQESLREEKSVIVGNTITAAIGSNIFYGVLHEYGFEKDDVVRGKGKPFKLTIPERAPVRTGIEENADYISQEIGNSIDETLTEIGA